MVRVVVCLGPWRERAIGGPEVNQRLHGFQFLRLQHIESASCQDKVAETTVKLFL